MGLDRWFAGQNRAKTNSSDTAREDPSRRDFLRLTGKGIVFFAAGQVLNLLDIQKAFAAPEWEALDLGGKLDRLREGLKSGGPIRAWLEKSPPPPSSEIMKFFELLVPITEAMEAAERNPAKAPRIIREHLVDAESIPNLFKLTLKIRPEKVEAGKGSVKIGNGYLTQHKGRTYLVTAKHCVQDTHAEKLFYHMASTLYDPDIVVVALSDLHELSEKHVVVGPETFEANNADVFTTFAGEMYGEYWVSTRLSIPVCEATAGFLHDYALKSSSPANRAPSIEQLVRVGGDISIGPSFMLDVSDSSGVIKAQGRSGSLTLAEDLKTKQVYACGSFYAVGHEKVAELGNRAMLLSTDKLDLKGTLERAHGEYEAGRRTPVSWQKIPGVTLEPIKRMKLVSHAEPPQPQFVRSGIGPKN